MKGLKTGMLAGVVTAALVSIAPNASADTFMTVGTGGVTGVYYPAGGAVCRLVNARRSEHGLRCSVESTGGSVYNANALKRGEMELAIVQSDFQAYAYEGKNGFDEPFPEMRSLFSLHGEPTQLMVRKDAGIKAFEDLKGKRVNIGNPGSGHRVMMELVMGHVGITAKDFSLTSELKSSEQAAALCDNRIDAAFWAAGVPNGSTQEAAATCAIAILPLEGKWVDSFLESNTAYGRDTVTGGIYPGTEKDVPTFGARATVVTRADVDEDAVYQIVKSVFDSLDEFKQLHPALASLEPGNMASGALTAPLHPGAERYYREKGLIK
ncbi:TAXI family TRAP transporter solute-binding subunit [Pelagibius litoralis]|uniref:TAXI family TRAP transporter solute-binding subunit n=1 Tax=Pelagibius litoralis TaxID=374515 RepID=A0A967KBP0_9PROT|nr:TAXI family TRAP transporter solute-binding subunit [Pelagibius litoralis]NIA72268.1 TAXI family TRAP transporter solute-binding subunit [Pelagibius litoralis]